MKKKKNLRWHLAFILTLDTINNYLDRMTLPVAIIVINQSFEVTDSQYALISSLFFLAYAIMYAGGGRLMDKLGTYWGFLSINIFWGLAVLAHGITNSFIGLGISRFFLGIGEGGGFPAASKAVSEWFPAKERSTAFGIFNTGSSIGSVLAVPLFSAIMYFFNWRWVFFVSGSIGFVWVVYWSYFYRLPKDRPRWGERLPKDNIYITDKELNYIQTAHANEQKEMAQGKPEKVEWIKLFKDKELLGMIIAKFLTDAVWYFYILWTPKYLFDARGFDIKQVGYYGWIPFAAAACGSMLGGTFSSFLIKKGLSVNASRKIALFVAALFMPASAFILSVPIGWAIVFISMAYFGHQFWNVINQTLPTDLYPRYKVGSVAGIIGSSGAFGGVAVQLIAGWMITTLGGYGPVFVTLSFMHPLSFVIILIMIPRIVRLDSRKIQ
jgi:ACS family hexuronate transporter-like MFS transporter